MSDTTPPSPSTARGCGVLCSITSLPSPFGAGDLGPGAHRFASLLAAGGQASWQVLPLNPTEPGLGNSPYASPSAFAGSTLLISPERLIEDGYLDASDLAVLPPFPEGRVDFPAVIAHRTPLLERAAARLLASPPPAFHAFPAEAGAGWLDDHCLYVACREHCGGRPWYEWPDDLRLRDPAALLRVRDDVSALYDRERALQFLFFDQWARLRRHCAELGVRLIGDLPIYVPFDSADAWAHPELFKLDADRRPLFVAGVPPDYFSAEGQRWGNPVYDWEQHRQDGYAWWLARFRSLARLFDVVRIDHFCGFVEYWEIPASEPTARQGFWQPGPGLDLFSRVRDALPHLALIAEDLGHVTPVVDALRDALGVPGMRVLLFGFGPAMASSPHIPHNHDRTGVLYLGTHDNTTARGWFEEASDEERSRLARYLGRPVEADTVADALVRLCLQSVAQTAIIPLQDHLGLGPAARMNRPGTALGNWEWRCPPDALSPALAARLADLASTYGRTAPPPPGGSPISLEPTPT